MRTKGACGILAAVALVLFLGASAEAQLAKSGTATSRVGCTFIGETKEVGENRIYQAGIWWCMSFNEAGKGFLHDTAWYGTGAHETLKGIFTGNGDCALTDMDGDKIYLAWRALPYTDPKGPIPTEGKISSGTGKYTGIQGGYTCQWRGSPTGNHSFGDCKANYQLP